MITAKDYVNNSSSRILLGSSVNKLKITDSIKNEINGADDLYTFAPKFDSTSCVLSMELFDLNRQ